MPYAWDEPTQRNQIRVQVGEWATAWQLSEVGGAAGWTHSRCGSAAWRARVGAWPDVPA